MVELRVGAAKVEITPAAPCWMEGYGNRKENGPMSTGVHDRIHARALVAEGEGGTVAIASCDLCNLDPDTVSGVRALVCGPLAMPPEHVMVVTTHNHSGPVTDYPHAGAPKTNTEWLDALTHKVAEAILGAHRARRTAVLRVVRGASRIGLNRQQSHSDGMAELGQAPEKPTDPELILLVLDTPERKPIARLVNYGCHNTSLGPGNTLISGDYAGRAMSALEAALGHGAVCLFVNGGAGNVDPFYRVLPDAADPRVQQVADTFTHDVLDALKDAGGEPAASSAAGGAFGDLPLPRKLAGVEAGLGRLKLVRAQAIRIGDAVIVGAPNEIVCEIAMNIKKRSPASNTLVAGYCYNAVGPWHRGRDGSGGYICAASHFDQGGYEVRVSPYAPEAEEVFTRGMVQLVTRMLEGDSGGTKTRPNRPPGSRARVRHGRRSG